MSFYVAKEGNWVSSAIPLTYSTDNTQALPLSTETSAQTFADRLITDTGIDHFVCDEAYRSSNPTGGPKRPVL